MMKARKTIAVRLDPADDARLREVAQARGETLSAVARELLARGLARLEAPTDEDQPPRASGPRLEDLPARRIFSKRDLEALVVALLARAALGGDEAPLVGALRAEAEARYGASVAWELRDALQRLAAAGWVELLEDPDASAAKRSAGVQTGGRTYPRARLALGAGAGR